MSKSTKGKQTGGILRRRSGGESTGIADWANAEPELLSTFIAEITRRGGAVRFGYTRDGGAYSIGIYLGDERETDYIRPSEDINDALRDYISSVEDLPITQSGR